MNLSDSHSGRAVGRPWYRGNVLGLGLTSLFTDISSEMIVPVLPLFLTQTLKASTTSLGIIEGIAESTASLLRLLSGWVSDRSGRRKPFLVAGYGVSTLAKAAYGLAGTWPAVLALRFTDRLGKGVRNPPRDALLADSVSVENRGRAFGLHRSMDTLGAAIGPLLAFALLAARPGDFRAVFLLSAVPGLLSLLVLGSFVTGARPAGAPGSGGGPPSFRSLGPAFYRFLAADAFYQLGNISLAFVILRGRNLGLSDQQIPLFYFLYNLFHALLSFPLGRLSDRIGRRPLLLSGYLVFGGAQLVMARADSVMVYSFALMGLGLHSSLIEAQAKSFVADLVPATARATAYGAYHTMVGLMLLPASIMAGALWDHVGPAATFSLSAGLALAAALLFALIVRPVRPGAAAA